MTQLESGVRLFNDGEFFRAHEALEEIWKAEVWKTEQGPRRLFLQSLIHLAVALHHWQQGNPAGAEAQLRKGLQKLEAYLPACEGIDTARLFHDAQSSLGHIETRDEGWEYPRIHCTS